MAKMVEKFGTSNNNSYLDASKDKFVGLDIKRRPTGWANGIEILNSMDKLDEMVSGVMIWMTIENTKRTVCRYHYHQGWTKEKEKEKEKKKKAM